MASDFLKFVLRMPSISPVIFQTPQLLPTFGWTGLLLVSFLFSGNNVSCYVNVFQPMLAFLTALEEGFCLADSQSVLYILQSTLSQVSWGREHVGSQLAISSHVLSRLRIERLRLWADNQTAANRTKQTVLDRVEEDLLCGTYWERILLLLSLCPSEGPWGDVRSLLRGKGLLQG